MTEILTESFCERCGTRYTFEPVDSRRRPLSAFGTLGRGIRHFVSDPDSSLDEAFAVARSEEEQRSTAHALEAFHRTFNFCLTCRQYTCGDCWNAVEGRCLTCAPTPDAAEVPAPRVDMHVALPPMDLARAPAVIGAEDAAAFDGGPWIGSEAELQEKLGTEVRARAQALAEAEAEAIATADAAALAAEDEARRAAELAAEADAAALEAAAAADAAAREAAEEEAQAAALEAARAAAEAEAAEEQARLAAEEADRAAAETAAQAAAEDARAAAEEAARAAAEEARVAAEAAAQQAAAEAAAQAALAFEPGRNLDDEIAAYERRLAAEPEAAAAEPEPAAEAQPEVEPVAAEASPGPVAAEASAEELPIAAAAATPTFAAPIEPIPTAIGQPWPASVVDGPLSWPDPGVAAAAFEPQWPDIPVPARTAPAAPSQPQPTARLQARGANLPAVSTPPQPVAAHACPSCGLSLSASARFCRRCGTPQQVASSPR